MLKWFEREQDEIAWNGFIWLKIEKNGGLF
jgi:hypothetical protein